MAKRNNDSIRKVNHYDIFEVIDTFDIEKKTRLSDLDKLVRCKR